MDNRCAVCKVDLGRRKLSQALTSRLQIVCPHCASTIALNVHRSEAAIVWINGAIVLALGASAYWYQSQALTMGALVAAGIGAALLPLAEVTWLRAWPCYVQIPPSPEQGKGAGGLGSGR